MPTAARVLLQLAGQDVIVVFSDRGVAFNPLDAPLLDLAANLEQRGVGGLGIHLVRQIMVDLAYQRPEGWNRITMRRPYPRRYLKVNLLMLQVTQETRSGWCVVTVTGRAGGETADQLETALRTAAEQHDKVAVDSQRSITFRAPACGLCCKPPARRKAETPNSPSAP